MLLLRDEVNGDIGSTGFPKSFVPTEKEFFRGNEWGTGGAGGADARAKH